MEKKEKSVIIIGAGLAGLSSGCFAQMNGYRSHILEHHRVPGGVAACWKRQGYLIDGGIHFIMAHKPGSALNELYQLLGVGQPERYVDMTTYGRLTDELSGRSIEVTPDLDRFATDLKAISPADAAIIDELVAGARAFQGMDMSTMGMGLPPELSGPLSQARELWAMRRLFKYFSGKYAQTVAEYVKDVQNPWVGECIKNLFLPQVPVWFIFMVLALLADGQMGFLKKGCLDFVLGIEKRYKELGGQVTYKATVEEILVEPCPEPGADPLGFARDKLHRGGSRRKDKAVGVRLADGREFRADAVISAADGRSTIFDMLGGRYVNKKIRERYAGWPLFPPLLMVNYGVAREFPDEPPFITIRLEQALSVANRPKTGLFVRIFNYSPAFAPPGKTVVQVELETEWDYWNDLQREDRAQYDAEKARLAAEVLERLERHFPGISDQVEMTNVATPYTTWRYTRNHKGAWEGWMITAEIMMQRVERTLPGLDDFYMAGQWVMPGGGVPPCLYSGQHAVQLLCHRDKKPFVTAVP